MQLFLVILCLEMCLDCDLDIIIYLIAVPSESSELHADVDLYTLSIMKRVSTVFVVAAHMSETSQALKGVSFQIPSQAPTLKYTKKSKSGRRELTAKTPRGKLASPSSWKHPFSNTEDALQSSTMPYRR